MYFVIDVYHDLIFIEFRGDVYFGRHHDLIFIEFTIVRNW